MKRLPGVQASRGCTEPVSIALAAALAARAATGAVLSVAVACDRNTLKNAQGPGIPGTGGLKGALLAAALGALAGDPERALEVLASISPEDTARAQSLIAAGAVRVDLHPGEDGRPRLWVEAQVTTDAGRGRARLEDAHTRLVEYEVGGAPVAFPAWATSDSPRTDPTWEGWSLAKVVEQANQLDDSEAEGLLSGLQTNMSACAWERAPETGGDLPLLAELLAERGSVARMEGHPVTVVTSGFSGNQGLVATIPLGVLAHDLQVSHDELARALAISHLVASYVRSFTGVLSPLCNAAQAASAGAAAGCVRLLGGGLEAMEQAAKRILATSGGVVCDGAKPACSLKVGLGAAQAIRAARRVLAGSALETADGIAAASLQETAENLSRIAFPGMARADEELLAIILSKPPAQQVGDPPPR